MPLFAAMAEDRAHFDRAMSPAEPKRRSWRELLANDAFAVLMLWRLRVWARRHRVPLVNHVSRRAQTVLFGIELGNEVTLGRGVCFVHPVAVVGGHGANRRSCAIHGEQHHRDCLGQRLSNDRG